MGFNENDNSEEKRKVGKTKYQSNVYSLASQSATQYICSIEQLYGCILHCFFVHRKKKTTI